MASTTPIESAKIYQFPAGGRAGLKKPLSSTSKLDEMERAVAGRIAVGGSWYHDEAVEAEKPAKR